MDVSEISIDCHFVSANKWEYTASYQRAGFKAATMSITHNSRVIPNEDIYDLKQRLIGHIVDNGLERDAWAESHPVTSQDFSVF